MSEEVAPSVVELRIPAKSDYVSLARVVVGAAAAIDPDSRSDRVDDLRIAVSEAVTNAMEANIESGATTRIGVICTVHSDRVEVEVVDQGPGFDPETVFALPEPDTPERLMFEHGLGLPLMKQLADETRIDSGDEGTSVRLVVYTARRPT